MILEAAATLPPEKGRALISAATKTQAAERDAFIARAMFAFETVMGQALIEALSTREETSQAS